MPSAPTNWPPRGALDLLSDPEAIAQLREKRATIEASNYVTGDELHAKYLARNRGRQTVRTESPRRSQAAGPAPGEGSRGSSRAHARTAARRPERVSRPLQRKLEGLYSGAKVSLGSSIRSTRRGRWSRCSASTTARASTGDTNVGRPIVQVAAIGPVT